MWKYVSRRIKDTVEKTYIVFDVRSACYTSSIHQNNKCLKLSEDGCSSEGGDSDGSSSGRERFKSKFGTSSGSGIHNSFLGALTWSSAIICGWYASQLLCLNRRSTGWNNHVPGRCHYSKFLFSQSRSLHNNVLSHWAVAAPEHSSETNYRQNLIFDEQNNEFNAQKFVYEIGNEQHYDEEIKSQPETFETAAQTLLTVLGDIEYQLGVQNIKAGQYETAVSHLKLGTSHSNSGATFNLGLCYEQGLGVSKDLRMAMECYQVASSMGHPKAMYNLGVFYAHGLGGLRKSRKNARECFLAAANLGQREAKIALGVPLTKEEFFAPEILLAKETTVRVSRMAVVN